MQPQVKIILTGKPCTKIDETVSFLAKNTDLKIANRYAQEFCKNGICQKNEFHTGNIHASGQEFIVPIESISENDVIQLRPDDIPLVAEEYPDTYFFIFYFKEADNAKRIEKAKELGSYHEDAEKNLTDIFAEFDAFVDSKSENAEIMRRHNLSIGITVFQIRYDKMDNPEIWAAIIAKTAKLYPAVVSMITELVKHGVYNGNAEKQVLISKETSEEYPIAYQADYTINSPDENLGGLIHDYFMLPHTKLDVSISN